MSAKIIKEEALKTMGEDIVAIRGSAYAINVELNRLVQVFEQSKDNIDYIKFGVLLNRTCTNVDNLVKILNAAGNIEGCINASESIEDRPLANEGDESIDPADKPKYIGED